MTSADDLSQREDALCRAVLRHRSVLVLLRRGHTDDALLLLVALLQDLKALSAMLPPTCSWQKDVGASLGQAATFLDNAEQMRVADMRRCAALCRHAIFTLHSIYNTFRKGAAHNTARRRRRLWASLGGLCLVLLLGWGGQRFWTARQIASRLRETKKSVIELANLASQAKKRRQTTVLYLTGNSCSECVCKTGQPLFEVPAGNICMGNWIKALTTISEAATGQPARDITGRLTVPERWARDSWGSPYLLNENEGEEPGTCKPDVLRSAGPDGLPETDDDIVAAIPPAFCP